MYIRSLFLESESLEGLKDETASEGTEYTYSDDFEVSELFFLFSKCYNRR